MIVYQIKSPHWHKTTCSESENRNFDCQWNLVSFLVKLKQFYREARLTCPLYRPTEDICIGIYVFKRVCYVWLMLKKGVNATTFEQFVRKQRRLEGKYLWSWTTKVWLCKSIFPTRTVKGTVQFDFWILDISNFVSSGGTLNCSAFQYSLKKSFIKIIRYLLPVHPKTRSL